MIQRLDQARHRLVVRLFNESTIDYAQQYIRLFSAYNIWFRCTTHETIDSLAIKGLKHRPALWRACFDDECMTGLLPLTRKLAILTQHRPLQSRSVQWQGYLADQYDWRSLIDLWYTIRCDIVHGSVSTEEGHYPVLLKLAYESLFAYMTEIVRRMQLCESEESHLRVSQLFKEQFIISPNISEVDMEPAQKFNRLFELHEKEHHLSTDKPFTS